MVATKATEPAVNGESDPVITPQAWTPPAVVPDEDGFYHDADWVRIECEWPGLKPRPGFKPLWAEIDTSLTFDEAIAIPNPFESPFSDIYPYVCPRVRAWNARGRDAVTGEIKHVPPPMEIGPDAFRSVRPAILVWLAFTLKTLHLGGGPNRGKETSASDDGSSGANDGV